MAPTRASTPSPPCPSARPRLLLCADLMHTQGTAMYVFLSYLAIALRLVQELPCTDVAVQLPDPNTRPPFGFGMGIESLFTGSSLGQVAARAGFRWLSYDRLQCSWAYADTRIAERLHVHRGFAACSKLSHPFGSSVSSGRQRQRRTSLGVACDLK